MSYATTAMQGSRVAQVAGTRTRAPVMHRSLSAPAASTTYTIVGRCLSLDHSGSWSTRKAKFVAIPSRAALNLARSHDLKSASAKRLPWASNRKVCRTRQPLKSFPTVRSFFSPLIGRTASPSPVSEKGHATHSAPLVLIRCGVDGTPVSGLTPVNRSAFGVRGGVGSALPDRPGGYFGGFPIHARV